jgi:hypothetical protein
MGQSLPKHDVRCMSASPPDSDQISNRERGRLVPEGDMATTRQGRPELRSSGREFSPNFAITASDIAVPLSLTRPGTCRLWRF